LGGQVAFGGADRFEGVTGGLALAAAGGGEPARSSTLRFLWAISDGSAKA
jgi:hypothetical protein